MSQWYQENILLALLDFNYKWISQYLSRIFYRGGRNSEELLLAYIENLNSYQNLTFLWELPVFLFVFAKEKSLRQYCFLRVADIILAFATATVLGGYTIRFISSGQLPFTLRDPMTWIAWFQSLPLPVKIANVAVIVLILGYSAWMIDGGDIPRIILLTFAVLSLTMIDFAPPAEVAYRLSINLIVLSSLPGIVTLKLKFHKATRKLRNH